MHVVSFAHVVERECVGRYGYGSDRDRIPEKIPRGFIRFFPSRMMIND